MRIKGPRPSREILHLEEFGHILILGQNHRGQETDVEADDIPVLPLEVEDLLDRVTSKEPTVACVNETEKKPKKIIGENAESVSIVWIRNIIRPMQSWLGNNTHTVTHR